MRQKKLATLTKASWDEVRTQVLACNPVLANIIDGIDDNANYPLYMATYPYGSEISQQGVLHIANSKGKLVPITDSNIEPAIKNDLHYQSGLPVGLSLEKQCEAFHSHDNRIAPLKLWKPGECFGLAQQLDNDLSYHCSSLQTVSAGARSIMMLPKITDSNSQKRLNRAFDLRSNPPKQLHEQWPLFVEMFGHKDFPQAWQCTVLFFSKSWFDEKNDSEAWLKLKNHFLQSAWQQSQYWHYKHMGDLLFSHVQANRNLKPNPHLADAVKHLIHIGAGAVPGFSVATNNDAAPISGLQQVYQDVYQLKHYAPVFLQTQHFAIDVPDMAVYYSLQLPTSLEFSPKSRNLSSTMGDLHEIKHIMDTFQSEILSNTLHAKQTPYYKQALHVKFDYFHSEEDKYQEVQNSKVLFEEDKALSAVQTQYPDRTYSESSPFVRGCIRVSSINPER